MFRPMKKIVLFLIFAAAATLTVNIVEMLLYIEYYYVKLMN